MEKLTRVITLPVSQYQATIKEGDGYAEKLLFENQDKIHLAFPGFWSHLTEKLGEKTKPSAEDILNLTLPDQHVLAIEIFKLSYGNILKLTNKCGKCGKPADYDVDLNKLEMLPVPDGSIPPDPVSKLKLPRSKLNITIGYIRGFQELEEQSADSFDPNRFDMKNVRSIEGKDKVSYEEIIALPLLDHKVIRETVKARECGYVTEVTFKHGCGNQITQNILTDPSFLMPGFAG